MYLWNFRSNLFFNFLVFLVLLFAPALNSNCQAQSSTSEQFFAKHKRFLTLYRQQNHDLLVDYRIEESRSSEDKVIDYDLSVIEFGTKLVFPINEYVFYRGGLGYRFSDYSFSFSAGSEFVEPDFKMRLHYGFVRFGAGVFLSPKVLLTGFFDAGVASDFEDGVSEDIGTEEFQAELIVEVNPGAQLVFGVRKGYEFEDVRLYPLAGIRLMDTEGRLRLNLTLPIIAKLDYRVFDWMDLYSLLKLGGQRYEVEMAPGEQTGVLHVIERRAGVGLQILPGKIFVLQLEAGVGLDDSLDFNLSDSDSPLRSIDRGPYLSVGIGMSL